MQPCLQVEIPKYRPQHLQHPVRKNPHVKHRWQSEVSEVGSKEPGETENHS